jgi:L-ascorbate metabolism protein UlaG (beta-lactamase superfamily)
LLLDDDHNAVLTDGFFSRPSLARVALGRIAPDHARIDHALQRAAVERLNAVVPLHSHYDHVLDSPAVAERTGAVVVGGRSAANVARGQGLPPERVLVVGNGDTASFGAFELTWVGSEHCPPDRYPGTITAPVVPPTRAGAYHLREYWAETVTAIGARRVVLIHWDDFFRPLVRPLRALPFAGDDLDVTMRVLTRLADRDGVTLHLPRLWRREDPWVDLP